MAKVRLTAGKNEWDPGYRTAPEKPKWEQPGWRIEKEYKPRVLIGNWYEDRLQVSEGTCGECIYLRRVCEY